MLTKVEENMNLNKGAILGMNFTSESFFGLSTHPTNLINTNIRDCHSIL